MGNGQAKIGKEYTLVLYRVKWKKYKKKNVMDLKLRALLTLSVDEGPPGPPKIVCICDS